MAKYYRQNASYKDIMKDSSEEEQEEKHSSGNTRLPFGLCKKYRIPLPDDATPRDAWAALEGKTGLKPDQVYEHLASGKELPQKMPTEDVTTETEKKRMLNDPRCVYNKRFTQQFMENNLEAGNREARDLTVKLFNQDSFGYNANERETAYYTGYNKVCIREKDIGGEENDSVYSKGGVFYHETWHAIDANFGDGSNKDCLSTTYKGSAGMTIQEMLEEECKTIEWDSVKKEIDRDIDLYYSSQGLDRKKIMADAMSAVNEAQAIFNKVFEKTKSYTKASSARSDYLNSQEYIRIMDNYQKVKKTPKAMNRKWGDLSDVYSGVTKDRARLVSMGHSRKYWANRDNRGTEVFAEIASAKATNPESYKLFQKYLPRVVDIFEEIYKKLKNGEIKPKGRTKYAP